MMSVFIKNKHIAVGVAISMLASDNGFDVINYEEWPMFIDYDVLQNQLGDMHMIDLCTLIQGEQREARRIVSKYSAYDAYYFLNQIFDGGLHDYFFTKPKYGDV